MKAVSSFALRLGCYQVCSSAEVKNFMIQCGDFQFNNGDGSSPRLLQKDLLRWGEYLWGHLQ